MTGLDEILDGIIEREETLFEVETSVENIIASVLWTYQGSQILVRFGVAEGRLCADVSGWQNGGRTPLSVSDAFETAVIYMG